MKREATMEEAVNNCGGFGDLVKEETREMAIAVFKQQITTYLDRRRELEQARRDLEVIKSNEQTEMRILQGFGIDTDGVDKEYSTQRYFAESLLRDRERSMESITARMDEAIRLLEDAGMDTAAARELMK